MHTPGPWEVEHERNKFDSACDELAIVSPALDMTHSGRQTSVPRIVLARLNVRAFAPHMAEPEANARLIAAAPELLKALERLLDATSCNFDDALSAVSECDIQEAREIARAAIAKALGKQS